MNTIIDKLNFCNQNLLYYSEQYNSIAAMARFRLFSYLSIIITVSLVFLLLFTINYFVTPLLTMDNAARSIIMQRTALREVHIPYMGNNLFGRLGLALRKLMTYLTEIDSVKGNILSQVTHDLKSPLSTMKQGIDILEDESFGKLSDKQKEILNLMYSGYETMNKLITNLVNAAQIEYNTYRLKMQNFDLIQLIRDILDEFEMPLKHKGIEIQFNHKRRQKFDIVADKKGIEDVVRNLVGNAIKFTPDTGSIKIELDLVNYDVHLSITDNGIGIPKDEIDKIFEKLYRAKNSKSISVKGTGLGLFIVKSIIQQHNGEIFVRSELNKGTTFEIHIPRIQASRNIIGEKL